MSVPRNSLASPVTGGRVLVAGATGYMGRFIAEASLDSGRPTYILVRPGSTSNSKAKTIEALRSRGAIVVHGCIGEKEQMEKILKENEIDIVICVTGGDNLLDQIILAQAIKSVGTVKRFLPSEFGHDADRTNPVEPGLAFYKEKRKVRRFIEESSIPYTYICCNSIASWPYPDNTRPSEIPPPLDQIPIYGDGSVKAYFVTGPDIGKFTMKAVDDDRTINKLVHFRPSCNMYNMNELASLWEKKIKRNLPRVTISEQDLLDASAENRIPESIVASHTHDIFIKGCQINFQLDGARDLEISSLYLCETYHTLEQCFEDFADRIN